MNLSFHTLPKFGNNYAENTTRRHNRLSDAASLQDARIDCLPTDRAQTNARLAQHETDIKNLLTGKPFAPSGVQDTGWDILVNVLNSNGHIYPFLAKCNGEGEKRVSDKAVMDVMDSFRQVGLLRKTNPGEFNVFSARFAQADLGDWKLDIANRTFTQSA